MSNVHTATEREQKAAEVWKPVRPVMEREALPAPNKAFSG